MEREDHRTNIHFQPNLEGKKTTKKTSRYFYSMSYWGKNAVYVVYVALQGSLLEGGGYCIKA